MYVNVASVKHSVFPHHGESLYNGGSAHDQVGVQPVAVVAEDVQWHSVLMCVAWAATTVTIIAAANYTGLLAFHHYTPGG